MPEKEPVQIKGSRLLSRVVETVIFLVVAQWLFIVGWPLPAWFFVLWGVFWTVATFSGFALYLKQRRERGEDD